MADQTHIIGSLWVGSFPQDYHDVKDFKHIVSVCELRAFPLDNYILIPMKDTSDVDECLANGVASLVGSLSAGSETLLHCSAGQNRSGLIATLVLQSHGYTARDAIKLLREKRENMLNNEAFERWLLR